MPKAHYVTEGQPLSQTALYNQRLKEYYNTPVKSLGVQSNASDTAALLAASADLTVRPAYERTVAPEAHVAANSARPGPVGEEVLAARSSSIKTQGTGIPSINSGGVYKVANQQSSSTMTSRLYPEHNIQRHGIATSQLARRAADASGSAAEFDIKKISSIANQNSSKSLSSRFNPTLDYRSGLAAHQPAQFLTNEHEIEAEGAASASLREGYTHSVASQKRTKTFTAADAINPGLLAAANKQASDRLKSISSSGTPQDFRNQAQLYAKALTKAQERADERMRKHNAGEIQLGLGATITEAELTAMAEKIVAPVLQDIDTKAASQREHSEGLRAHKENLFHQHKQAKLHAKAMKEKERVQADMEKHKRMNANQAAKVEEDNLHKEWCAGQDEELVEHTKDLRATEEAFEREKEELAAQKEQVQKDLDEQEAEAKEKRDTELKELQGEKDELIAPIHTELEESNLKLAEVTNAHDEVKTDHDAADELNAKLLAEIAELEARLKKQSEDIEFYTEGLSTVERRHKETDEDVAELTKSLDDQIAGARTENKDLDNEISELKRQQENQASVKQQHRDQILGHVDQRVKDEHKINKALPDHLKQDVDETKLRDTSDLLSIDEPEPEPIREVTEKTAEVKGEKDGKPTDEIIGVTEGSFSGKKSVAIDDEVSEAKDAVPELKTKDVKASNDDAKDTAKTNAGDVSKSTAKHADAASIGTTDTKREKHRQDLKEQIDKSAGVSKEKAKASKSESKSSKMKSRISQYFSGNPAPTPKATDAKSEVKTPAKTEAKPSSTPKADPKKAAVATTAAATTTATTASATAATATTKKATDDTKSAATKVADATKKAAAKAEAEAAKPEKTADASSADKKSVQKVATDVSDDFSLSPPEKKGNGGVFKEEI